jgi:hypothetical protein
MKMSDGSQPVAFSLQPKSPQLVLAAPKPRIDLKGVRYSILPARAVQDPRINSRPHLLLLLAAICLHTNPSGVCYPSQARLAKLCGRSPPWVSRYIRDLEAYGYVQRLVSLSKRKRHAFRRIVIYEEGAPLPPLERPEPMPWAYPFSENQPKPEKETQMATVNASEAQARVIAENKALSDGWHLADYFCNRYSALFGRGRTSDAQHQCAMKWLKVVDMATAKAHIDRQLNTAKLANPGLRPSDLLSDYPAPTREKTANA